MMICPTCNRATLTHCGWRDCPRPRVLTRARREHRRVDIGGIIFTVLIALLLLALWASGVFAQDFPPPAPEEKPCGPRAEIVYRLANKYLETELAMWVGPGGSMVQLFGNPDTGTSTLIVVVPNKPDEACIVGAGQMLTLTPYERGEPT